MGTAFEPPELLCELPLGASHPVPTGLTEFDRVLGGGLVPGSVTLVGGEPGIGKSTLLLQAAGSVVHSGRRCLMISAEESPSQVRGRAERLAVLGPGLWIVGATSMPAMMSAIEEVSPDLVIVDSIQTVWDPDIDSGPGSVAQVKGCAHQLVTMAKSGGWSLLMVGHVTKDGSLAGPRVLEHLVDTVLSFEGDRHYSLRLMRAVKHRYGPSGEIGLFEMTESGLEAVDDPSRLFLADRVPDTPGSVVFPSLEGRRLLLVEIQALAFPTGVAGPRRSVSGFDLGRLSLLLAVMDRRAGLNLQAHEVYLSVVGGLRVSDPGADLAVCLAVASAATHRPVDSGLVVVGEVGLGGEVRQVSHTERRLAEAGRLGFTRAAVPPLGPGAAGIALCPVATVAEALDRHLDRQAPAPRLRLVQ